MIIKALSDYYDTLLQDPDSGVSKPGMSKVGVSHVLVISPTGELTKIIDLRVDGKKSKEMHVPEQKKRASGIVANYFCDKGSYILGIPEKGKDDKKGRNRETFKAFVELNKEALKGVDDLGAKAFMRFLDGWDSEKALEHPEVIKNIDGLSEGRILVFQIEGEDHYLHEKKQLLDILNRLSDEEESVTGQCLVTGEIGPISRLNASIKGVKGAQSSGASLVSFNLEAFKSYGKEQNYNSPIGKAASFAYTTGLNYLLDSKRNRISIGDTTTVFWAEKPGGLEEDIFSFLISPDLGNEDNSSEENSKIVRDEKTDHLLRDVLSALRTGRKIGDINADIDQQTKFYILGLSPNAARIAVRYWYVDTFGNLLDKIGHHYRDMALEKSYANQPDVVSIPEILRETAPLRDYKRIPPLLGGVLMRSVITGSPYPKVLYNSMISRIRADRDVNYTRASVIKACLVRNQRFHQKGREVDITMSLDPNSNDTAYRLGRLFALLEKAQQDANPGINATIKDRYFGSASASPGSVFPILLRLSQHHIAKAEYGHNSDRKIGEVMEGLDQFPAHLNLEEQGRFILGYYHQRVDIYKKKNKEEV